MKKITFLLIAVLLIGTTAYASPERREIKKKDRRVKEQTAKANLKGIDLQEIEDPAARKAIGEILNYLNLPSKK